MPSFTKVVVVLGLSAVLLGYILREKLNPEDIRGKRVIVTGASTGIGEQLAYQYSKLGARVLITARREAVLQKVVETCKELGAQEAYYIPLDMARLNDTEVLIQEAERRFGGLDFLILNHIFSNFLHLWDASYLERLHKTMDINFRAYAALASYAMPMLAESKGSIGVISSVAGQIPVPFLPCYSASKFALHGFFGSLRQDFAFEGHDISISEFIIGSINTTNAVKYAEAAYKAAIFDTSPTDTANRIIEGTALRERKVYFPWYTRVTLLRDFFPGLLEKLVMMNVEEGAAEKLIRPKI